MKRIAIIPALILTVFITACEKDLPDPGGTAAERMANEWWVQLYQDGQLVYPPTYHAHIATYNTADNNNTIWVDDMHGIWDFKVKANADFNNLTFSATQAESVIPGYNIKVDIMDGKMLPGAARSKTGNVTDSIYMRIMFEDDPGTEYVIAGHARTKFAEDEY